MKLTTKIIDNLTNLGFKEINIEKQPNALYQYDITFFSRTTCYVINIHTLRDFMKLLNGENVKHQAQYKGFNHKRWTNNLDILSKFQQLRTASIN